MNVKYSYVWLGLQNLQREEISSYMSQSSGELKHEWVTSLNDRGTDRRG